MKVVWFAKIWLWSLHFGGESGVVLITLDLNLQEMNESVGKQKTKVIPSQMYHLPGTGTNCREFLALVKLKGGQKFEYWESDWRQCNVKRFPLQWGVHLWCMGIPVQTSSVWLLTRMLPEPPLLLYLNEWEHLIPINFLPLITQFP